MSRTILSARQARLVLASFGALLLVQFWGGAAVEILMGKAVEFHKGRPPTCARRDTAPAAFWSLIRTKLTLGAVLGGGMILLAQGIWYLNRTWPPANSAQGQVPGVLNDGRLSRRWLIILAAVATLLLASQVIAILVVRRS